MEDYKILSSKQTYEGRIIDVYQDVISLPNGRDTVREIVIRGDGAAVVPVDEDGNILFVRQYRHPAKAMMLELPAGTVERGEAPLECVVRELEEETGMKGGRFTHAVSMYSTVGYCNEVLHIYIAEDLTFGSQKLDDDEILTIEKYSLKESLEMIRAGDITDAKTIVGIMYYKDHIGNNQ